MEPNYRIGGGTEFLMKSIAYAVYGTNFVIQLFANWVGIGFIVSPIFMGFSYAFFAFWFMIKGSSIFDPKVFIQFAVSALISLIPFVNMLYFRLNKNGLPEPGIVAMVSRVIGVTRDEDIAEMKKNPEEGEYERRSYRERGGNNRYEEDIDEAA
jgi:hypothetical protein